jgi:AbrB family looped-hinge helix DNA binding protein
MKDETKVTRKYQTTIPKDVRKYLDIKPGGEVRWHVIKGIVVVDVHKKIRNPVKFLTSQTKLDVDAVKLVREVRQEFG